MSVLMNLKRNQDFKIYHNYFNVSALSLTVWHLNWIEIVLFQVLFDCKTCLFDVLLQHCHSLFHCVCVCRWFKGCSPRRSGWFGLVWCLRSLQQLGPHLRLLVIVLQALLTSHTHIYFHVRAKYLSRTLHLSTVLGQMTLWSNAVSFIFQMWVSPVSYRHFSFQVPPGIYKMWKMDKIPLKIQMHTVLELPSFNLSLAF